MSNSSTDMSNADLVEKLQPHLDMANAISRMFYHNGTNADDALRAVCLSFVGLAHADGISLDDLIDGFTEQLAYAYHGFRLLEARSIRGDA